MKKPFYKTKKFIFGAVTVLLIGGSCSALKSKRAAAEARRVAAMTAFQPERGDLVTKTQAAGTVEPENRVLVTPSVSGRAEEVLFEEGREVEKGAVLAWVSSSERTALLDSLKMKDSTPEERRMVEEAYNLTPVVAPISGMVVKRSVEPGQSVSPGKELAVISDRLIVKTFVDETDIGSVKEGQRAEFYLDAFPKSKREGRILAISHESVTKDGVIVYEVKVLPAGSTRDLRSGMTADVLITTGRKKGVLMIPKRAVKYRDGGAAVSVKASPAEPLSDKEIKTGAADERMIEVTEGLAGTDTVYYSTGIAGERSGFRMSF
ncbi:MAG: macrolide-specific efflux protein MacA [Elusimicrobia bacterium]|nr:MAG: macrolide-specific efflux protein MacA [Elusimicrobiota bacterium]KAF0158169.1 MAG: macrolide-specific efflux protein MacA [Elusimicrobiota bacterium]